MKLSANELKLGNLVNAECEDINNGSQGIIRFSIICRVVGISEKDGIQVSNNQDVVLTYDQAINIDYILKRAELKPIPLTEEWLLKFSFNHRIDRDIVAYEKKNLIVEYLFDRWTARLYETHLTSIQIIELKFVHQLQNLFFALTSTELPLK